MLALLLPTVMFSSPSYSKWTKVNKTVSGDTFYVDYERIRKQGGYRYFWQLQDYLKPTKYGILSRKTYNQVDCKLFRYRKLNSVLHKQPMGLGWWRTSPKKELKWQYSSPKTMYDIVLMKVCSRWVIDNEKTNSHTLPDHHSASWKYGDSKFMGGEKINVEHKY